MITIVSLTKFFTDQGITPDPAILECISYIRNHLKINLNIKTGPWIAGGSVLKLIQGKPLDTSDIDIFFPSPELFDKYRQLLDVIVDSKERTTFIPNYGKPNSLTSKGRLRSGVSQISKHQTSKAYTYSLNIATIQIIKRQYYQTVGALLGDFDFTVCMFATDGTQIAYFPQGLIDAKNMNLRIHRIHKDSILVHRFYKYLANGYTPLPGEARLIHEVVREDTARYALSGKGY